MDAPVFTPPPTLLIPGQQVTSTGVYVFTCPLCGKFERFDDRYEPFCTGPGALDTHFPEVMVCVGTDAAKVILL